MSGGVAYVYDPDGVFPGRLNTEMVALESLDDEDREWLKDRIGRHLAETGSAVAERLLEDWDLAAEAFVKVMPMDYKRVLMALRRAENEGSDPVAAVMAAAHG